MRILTKALPMLSSQPCRQRPIRQASYRAAAAILLSTVALLASGCTVNERLRAAMPVSAEAQLRKDVAKQLKSSSFPTAAESGAPQADR